ncbi:hypothetical protein E4U48_001633 [Claviceps purpurea]|nr:hypothetical protein E4U48_001633 [Claviceps purpurea]
MELKFDDAKLFSYTDSEIFEYISSLPSLPDYGAIVPLSHKYLAKAYATWDEVEDAVSAMNLAFMSHTFTELSSMTETSTASWIEFLE